MNGERARSLVLVLFGIVLLRLASGAELAHYVRPGTRPLVITAGALLVITGCMAVLGSRAGGRTTATTLASRAGWLLLAPAMAVGVVAPPPLGVLTANRAPVAPPQPSAGFAALPSSGPVPIRLSDVVLRTVWHAGSTLRDRTLEVVGFVSRVDSHGFVLSRLVITCCAADARPYDIAVRYPFRAPQVGQWVTVAGRYRGASAAGPVVPAMSAASVVPVAAPADPYG